MERSFDAGSNILIVTRSFNKSGKLYILIKKYPTFQSKSIPLTTMNRFYLFLTNDKYVYKTGNHY